MMNSWYGNGHAFGFSPVGIVGVGLILAVLFVVAVILKGYALWHSARRSEKWWFIALLVVNTMGILELAYLYSIVGKWHSFEDSGKQNPSAKVN